MVWSPLHIIPGFRELEEDQEFRVILSCIASLRLAWSVVHGILYSITKGYCGV